MNDHEVYYSFVDRTDRDAKVNTSELRPGNKIRYQNGDVDEYVGGELYIEIAKGGANNVGVKSKDNEPESWADGNSTGSIPASETAVLGDLTIYGYPYASLTFTNAGGNAAEITWGVSQGMLIFQIAGTTPNINLTATNTNGDTVTDVPVQALNSINPVTGQTLGAGHFILYRP